VTQDTGARIGTGEEAWGADIVFRVNGPSPGEVGKPKDGATVRLQ
jgi:proton-translocating NAD(P)+ transhydrogenase subunit alpha